ncbi:hypothetical protein [Desulfonatronum parangueonense]
MEQPHDLRTEYSLDGQDRLIGVSGAWDDFAEQNNGVNLRTENVLGRQIWDFVTGDASRMWLNTIFQLARVRGTDLERPYRCDSPTMKRFMRMTLIPSSGGILRIEHQLLAIEERSIPVSIRFGAEKALSKILLRCSFCGRIKQGNRWEEPCPRHADTCGEIPVVYRVCGDCWHSLPGRSKRKEPAPISGSDMAL